MSQLNLFGEPSPLESAQEQAEVVELTREAVPSDEELTPERKAELLAEVRERAVVCTKCRLAQGRTQVVFGEGTAAAPLVFIGEGPGETEDATGRPFVGRAGKLLEEVLRENGLAREHVYIANVVKCRPTLIEGGKVRNRAPDADEIAACEGWLEAQLQIIQPLVIVCLGAPSAHLVIHRNFRITQERGRWFENARFAPWVMATFHPAYVLRQFGEGFNAHRAHLVGDIAAARRKVIELKRAAKEGAPPPPPETLF